MAACAIALGIFGFVWGAEPGGGAASEPSARQSTHPTTRPLAEGPPGTAPLTRPALADAGDREDVVFPSDSGVVDVKASYGAKGDGRTDDTAAIQKALDEHPNQGAIIYLPSGVYVVSDTLKWPHGPRPGMEEKNTVLQGQRRERTILKLKDACPGYTAAAKPKAIVWTGQKPAQRFRNAVRNLTIDAGSGNVGAIGLQFMASNQGCVRDVTIRSTDGKGAIGLDMGYTDEIGPLLVSGVSVAGFEIGISTRNSINSMTLEHIALRGQGKYGIWNRGQCLGIRDLTSSNAVPALFNDKGTGLVDLYDARLEGTGNASSLPAVQNEASLLARNIRTSGYKVAIQSAGADNGPTGANVLEVLLPPGPEPVRFAASHAEPSGERDAARSVG